MQAISNARIVNEGRIFTGYVIIDDEGFINDVSEGPLPEGFEGETLDAEGHYLLPGVIDMHVHTRDPGMTHKGDLESETHAAVMGGVTSICDMPNTIPPTITFAAWRDKMLNARDKAWCNYAFWMGATSQNLDELCKADYTQIPGVKVFMGSSTGGLLLDEEDALDNLFANLPKDVCIAVHAEDNDLIAEATKEVKVKYPDGLIPVTEHANMRPSVACYWATGRAVGLALKHHRPLHVAHVSTNEELDYLEVGKPLVITEACVGHLWWTDEDYARLGSRIKCNPSIKSRNDRRALREAVEQGLIDIISTDHAPHLLSEKVDGASKAPSGFPSIQFSLPMMLTLWPERPEMVVEKMCHRPAEIFHIERRGFLRRRYWADMVLVEMPCQAPVRDYDAVSRCGWTPLAGETLRARVLRTWVNGKEPRRGGGRPLIFDYLNCPL